MNTITQTIIKIGDSAGVTIPAKDLKRAGLKPGDTIRLHYEPVDKPNAHSVEVVELTQQLITRHQQALKNLSQR